MPTTVVYVNGDNDFLVERTLKGLPADAQVVLLCDRRALSSGKNIQERHRTRVVACHSDEDAAFSETGILRQQTCLTLPLSYEMRPLPHRPSVEMPWLACHYPLFRSMGRLGFREIDVCSLAGCVRIPMPHMLDDFHNCHAGRRCFVVGNGPSLNAVDMTRLRDEITLGSNQCYLGYPDWKVHFTYWGISDQYQIEEYVADYEQRVSGHRAHFLPFEYLPLLRLPDVCPVNHAWCVEAAHQFSDSPERVYRGHTVTYMLMQIAAIMGCNPIILIGADHNYPLTKRYIFSKTLRQYRRWFTRRIRNTLAYDLANTVRLELIRHRARQGRPAEARLWEQRDAVAPTHFTEQYTKSGVRRFAPPEPEQAEADFRCARRWAEARNVRILNATPGSHLDVFERVDYDTLF